MGLLEIVWDAAESLAENTYKKLLVLGPENSGPKFIVVFNIIYFLFK
jgi:hypothetical protein